MCIIPIFHLCRPTLLSLGIYRDVYLQFMNPVHLATNDYASSGVYIRTPEVSKTTASIEVTALLTNELDKPQEVIVENVICDASGKEVKKHQMTCCLLAGETKTTVAKKIKMESPVYGILMILIVIWFILVFLIRKAHCWMKL